MTLWYVLFVIVLSCSRCTHFSCSYKQAPKDQWQRNNFSTAASSFGNNGAISQLLGAQGGGVGNGNAQTCSLNFLALTVGVLVETPIYLFLSLFLVPKVGDGDVNPSWSYGFQPEQGWIAQYCCFWNHLHQYAIC